MSRLDRRAFLLRTGQLGVAGWGWAGLTWTGGLSNALGLEMSAAQAQEAAAASAATGAAQVIPGKNPRLIVLKADPAVLETPLSLLAEHAVTPIAELFVRNNQQPRSMASLDPVPLEGWKIEIAGLVNTPKTLEAKLLTELPDTSVQIVLQCSGNHRSYFSKAAQTQGTQWGPGGMGCAKFTGVRLSNVLEHLGVEPKAQARFITADGLDTPPEGMDDFQHSMPLDEVLHRAILALKLNDRELPAIHGGPVRLIIPGVFGTMQIKWLTRLEFTTDEITLSHHVPRYRVPRGRIKPGQTWEATLANSRFNWRMPIKSVILAPATDSALKAGPVTIRGVAFNDGAAPIDTVLVSLDQGESWRKAQVEPAAGRYAWYPWTFRADLRKGRTPVWVRAIDKLGRSQPSDGSIRWNPRGYEWNGVDQIELSAT